MTSPGPGRAAISEGPDTLVRGYEQLRTDALDRRRVSSGGVEGSVLQRQGMIAWIRISQAKPSVERSRPKPTATPSAPVRSELLSVLTDLVFHTWARRSS